MICTSLGPRPVRRLSTLSAVRPPMPHRCLPVRLLGRNPWHGRPLATHRPGRPGTARGRNGGENNGLGGFPRLARGPKGCRNPQKARHDCTARGLTKKGMARTSKGHMSLIVSRRAQEQRRWCKTITLMVQRQNNSRVGSGIFGKPSQPVPAPMRAPRLHEEGCSPEDQRPRTPYAKTEKRATQPPAWQRQPRTR